jgi:GNAT superfamily N-acetyltransferase
MLHRAYAPLAARGLRYTATHQTPEVTADRLFKGHPLAAEWNGRIVGTITVYPPNPKASVAVYREPHTYIFGQFAVDPDFKGNGIGRALHQAAIDYAVGQNAQFMSLDTAAPAVELIATYRRWGYEVVERTHWRDTNYESVLMRRRITKVVADAFMEDQKPSRANEHNGSR